MFQPLSRKEYREKMGKEVYGKDDSPFCKKEEQKTHIVWEGKYWYILHNLSSYSGDHRHIMAVPYEHICFSKDISPEHFQELQQVHLIAEKFFWDQIYFSFTRESMANRSVEHLHMHFLVGKLQWKFLRKMLEVQWFPITQELNIN